MRGDFQTRVVLYVEIILLVIGTLGAVVVICLPSVYIDSILKEEEPDSPEKRAELKSQLGTLIAIVAAVVVIILLVWLLIVLLLYIGTKEKSIGRLMTWLIINCIITALHIFIILATLVFNSKLMIVHIPSMIFLGYRIWSLYVVRSYMIEIPYHTPPQPNYIAVQYSQPFYEEPAPTSSRHCQQGGGPNFANC